MTTDPLLQPFQLGSLTLRNRIMSTSHAIGYGEDGMPRDRYQRYHEEKARGGIGLTMFGGSTNVSPDSGNTFGQLWAGDDSVIPYLREFADRIHAHGAALMCQITHLGMRSHWRSDKWLPSVAPSRGREPLHRGYAKEMESADIARVIRDFGAAARRCREGGLDGIELHVTGHLIGQFWSPATNRRTDDYGGSLENRARFGLQVLEEVRAQAGEDFICGIRMVVGEGDGGTMPDDDYLALAKMYEASGLIDFFNFGYGRIDTELGLARYMPGMALGLAPQLRPVAAFRHNVGLPVFHAARINDLATARHAVAEGHVDLIGMTRAHIADPHIANKLAAGHEERIRPCVGATYCSWHGSCLHNPAIGREAVLPHVIDRADTPRRVTVVGAGPGGLEAARIAAERGHAVTVFEAAPRAGGQVLLAATLDTRRDLGQIIDWRVSELDRLGVDIRYNTLAEDADIAATDPNVVIVATGGVPDTMENVPGAELAMTAWDALETPGAVTGDVVFYDATGTIAGLSTAHTLASAGAQLTHVTPDSSPATEVSFIERPLAMRHFYASGARAIVDMRLSGIARAANRLVATFENVYSGDVTEIACDTFVFENGTEPADALYHALAGSARNGGQVDFDALVAGETQPGGDGDGFDLYRIGDAVSSRDIHAAMLEATRLCARM